MRKVLIVKPDVNFCSQNLLQSWGDAAREGFWRENFPNGITASLLESYGSFSRMLFAWKELPLLPPLPHTTITQTKPVLFLHTTFLQGSVWLRALLKQPDTGKLWKLQAALCSLQDLLCQFVHNPAGLELAPVQPAGNAGEHKFISKKTGSASYQI